MERHIYQLLHLHECVVIPNFGAFVLRYYPAELQEGTLMFRPPSRRVCFQPDLKISDGILAHYIARKEAISYREAVKRIEAEVKNWSETLRSGHSLALPGIGKLYQMPGNTLEFFPELSSNFLRDGYGFSIIRVSEKSKKIPTILSRTPVESAESMEQKVYTPWARRLSRVAAIVLPLALAVNMVSTSRTSPVSADQMAGMPGVEKLAPTKLWLDDEKSKASIETEASISFEDAIEESYPVNVSPEPVVKTVPKPVTESVTSAQHVHIVVGAFSEKGNAEKFIRELKGMGYADAAIVEGKGNLTRVSAASFATVDDARTKLEKIKQSVSKQAWIFTP
ncbi:MAG: SPOR domain-containing protein [Cryomorphaceae bacterium]|nr:SPOR domain-containing protein [Cryomorphaceae bacterium]